MIIAQPLAVNAVSPRNGTFTFLPSGAVTPTVFSTMATSLDSTAATILASEIESMLLSPLPSRPYTMQSDCQVSGSQEQQKQACFSSFRFLCRFGSHPIG